MTTVRDDLLRDEGLRLKVYTDTEGHPTIGVGRALDTNGITEEEALYLLDNDIAKVEAGLDNELPWWRLQPESVRRGLCNMCFQLGLAGLLKFSNMLSALERGDYPSARGAALDSLWAKQVPARAGRIIELFRP